MAGVYWSNKGNVIHAGNGREINLPWVLNVKVDGYSAKTREVFEYLRCFGMGVPECPINTSPLLTKKKNY